MSKQAHSQRAGPTQALGVRIYPTLFVLSPEGDVECTDLDCEDCDERAVCDALRDVVVKRRRRRGG